MMKISPNLDPLARSVWKESLGRVVLDSLSLDDCSFSGWSGLLFSAVAIAERIESLAIHHCSWTIASSTPGFNLHSAWFLELSRPISTSLALTWLSTLVFVSASHRSQKSHSHESFEYFLSIWLAFPLLSHFSQEPRLLSWVKTQALQSYHLVPPIVPLVHFSRSGSEVCHLDLSIANHQIPQGLCRGGS